MAFIGLLAVSIGLVLLVIVLSLTPIVVGTILIRKTRYRKTGTALRIIGYILILPFVVTAGTLFLMAAGVFPV